MCSLALWRSSRPDPRLLFWLDDYTLGVSLKTWSKLLYVQSSLNLCPFLCLGKGDFLHRGGTKVKRIDYFLSDHIRHVIEPFALGVCRCCEGDRHSLNRPARPGFCLPAFLRPCICINGAKQFPFHVYRWEFYCSFSVDRATLSSEPRDDGG